MTFTHFEITAHFETPVNVDWDPLAAIGDEFKSVFGRFCVDGIFQFERGTETERIHIQGHGILEKPVANIQAIVRLLQNTSFDTAHIRPTCTNVVDDFKHKRITFEQLYAAKGETRVSGPYRFGKNHKKTERYIPRQQREVSDEQLRPWQLKVMELAKEWDTRTVHVIMNKNGNEGKSWLAQRMRLKSNLKCFQVAAVKDGERLEADMCSKLVKANCLDPNVVFVDLPKAMPKDHMNGIYSSIEQIKSGYLNDSRNESHEIDFDSPNVFVFTNRWPDFANMLSADRWRCWILENHEMIEKNVSSIIDMQAEEELKRMLIKEDSSKKRKRSD